MQNNKHYQISQTVFCCGHMFMMTIPIPSAVLNIHCYYTGSSYMTFLEYSLTGVAR